MKKQRGSLHLYSRKWVLVIITGIVCLLISVPVMHTTVQYYKIKDDLKLADRYGVQEIRNKVEEAKQEEVERSDLFSTFINLEKTKIGETIRMSIIIGAIILFLSGSALTVYALIVCMKDIYQASVMAKAAKVHDNIINMKQAKNTVINRNIAGS